MSRFSFARPTLDTPFHVDWSWFDRNQLNSEQAVRDQLCTACAVELADAPYQEVDAVDLSTGIVRRTDRLREAITAHCQWLPDYLSSDLPLAQMLLRLFLTRHNEPVSVREIARYLGRHDEEQLLRMLTSGTVYNGIVPYRG